MDINYESEEYLSSLQREADDQRIKDKAAAGEELTDEELRRLEEITLREAEESRKASAQLQARIAAQDPTDEKAYRRSGPGMVDDFLERVKGKTFEPVSSGIPSLDRAIGGGFVRQSVILLGAAPGMGKTALMQQICEYIASKGQPVLYFNLEMSREVMLARSLSRIIYQQFIEKEHMLAETQKISVLDILHGYKWTDLQKDAIEQAADIYKTSIAKHLIYNPKDRLTDLDEIMKEIEGRKKEMLEQGYRAPVVCLDYLQLVTGREKEDTVQVIGRTMNVLKDYANRNHTLVFIVSANNRTSNQNGKSDLNSGRDSSSIEYGADLHLGIEYAAAHARLQPDGAGGWKKEETKDMDYINGIRAKYREWKESVRKYGNLYAAEYGNIQQEYMEVCARLDIRINKNRYNDGGGYAPLVFDGEATTFRELTEEERLAEKRKNRSSKKSGLPKI